MSREKPTLKRRSLEYLIITLAAILYGAATSFLIDPNDIAPGGITGVAIVMNRILNLGTGVWFMIINIPILIIGIYKFGIRFTVSTIYATLVIMFSTDFFAKYFGAYVIKDIILGVIFGSAGSAVAMGLIFKCGATTGGTDIIIKLLRLRFPHLKTGFLFFATDLLVVSFAGIVFNNIRPALYSLLSVLITSYTLDLVLYGRDGAKLIYIISDRPDIITSRLLDELDLGATHIYGEGAYSHQKKKVIMCVVKKRLSPMAQDIVREEDPEAFMIITSATEIFGEGYKSYFEERL